MVSSGADAHLKAELLAAGRVSVPKELLSGYRLSRSTAGPGAGGTSLALEWRGEDGRDHRIKLAVAGPQEGPAPLSLVEGTGGDLMLLWADGTLAVGDVRLLPIVMHAPDQAFINLSGECLYECAFCNTHRMVPGRRKDISPERWVELVLEAYDRQPFKALSITSVASVDHEAMMSAYETVITGVLARHPHLAVGVEPYIQGPGDILRLRRAGATEIKINVQTTDQEILDRICPGWDLERQYAMLEEAVAVFGRGRVTTNILLGLGESDTEVARAIDRLALMGVVPSLRAIRINEGNAAHLERAMGRPLEPVPVERHVLMAETLRDILTARGMSECRMDSMCHRCGCCDLEPGQDV
jgi:hypothetical protein